VIFRKFTLFEDMSSSAFTQAMRACSTPATSGATPADIAALMARSNNSTV
jgi:hypothetical protein